MPENSPIFEEQTLTSDMSNFLEEWGLPLEGDIQESFKPDPSIEANRQELEAVRGQEIFDKLPESMKVDPPTQEMLDSAYEKIFQQLVTARLAVFQTQDGRRDVGNTTTRKRISRRFQKYLDLGAAAGYIKGCSCGNIFYACEAPPG